MGIFVAALIALLSTVFLVRLFAPVAVSMGHVDEPGGRKTHRVPIPLIGGLCMLIGAQLGILAVPTPLGEYRGLFAGAILMLVTGFLDDVRELPARARFIAEIGTVLIAIALGGPVLHDFGNLLGNFQTPLGWFAIPVTVFCVVGVINALNMIDGADGLAGTMFLVCAGTMLILAGMAGAVSAVGVLAVVFGAVLGFLLLNARWRQDSRAQVFMGDAGSLTLGFLLAWFLVGFSQGPERLFEPATALWMFAVPLWDTVFVMIRRLVSGISPFAAGRDHLHHLFLRAGFSVRETWIIFLLLALAGATFGLIIELTHVPEYVSFYSFLAVSAGYYLLINRAWANRSWFGRAVSDA